MPPNHDPKTVKLETRIQDEHEFREVEVERDGTLFDVLQAGAVAAGKDLLPPDGNPLDRLHGLDQHGVVGPPLTLTEEIETYLHAPHTTKKFEIELVLAIRVNARWAIASSSCMTPRDILTLPGINLDAASYSLYLPNSTEPLPPDIPVTVHRDEKFEAQRDGKYGDVS
jgi:hypothetical protein